MRDDSRAQLEAMYEAPLRRVGTWPPWPPNREVWTIAVHSDWSRTPAVVWLRVSDDAYQGYALSGGP